MAIEETKGIITIHVPTKEAGHVPTREAGYKLNDRIWTKSFEPRIWAGGVLYCSIRDAKLQTLDGAVEFRHDTNGADYSADYQNTGTLIALVIDREALRAHVYEPEQEELEQ